MAETKTIKINVTTNAKEVTQDINQVTQATENLAEKSGQSGSKMKVFTDIKNVVTSMVPQFKAAEGGVNSFGASLKALMANPIVLMFPALTSNP